MATAVPAVPGPGDDPRRPAWEEPLLKGLAEANLVGVGVGRSSGEVLFANAEMLRLMGRSAADLHAGRLSWLEALSPQSREEVVRRAATAQPPGALAPLEQSFVHQDGSVVHFIGSGAPLPGQDDLHVVVAVDRTAARQAQEDAARAAQALAHLVQSNPFGLVVLDAGLHVQQASQGARLALGLDPGVRGQWLPALMEQRVSAEFAHRAALRLRAVLASGEPYRTPLDAEGASGLAHAFDLRAERVLLSDGRVGVACHFYDLRERRRLEASLRESEARFRSMADSLALIVWVHDAQGRQVWVNDSFCSFFGVTREQLGQDGWTALTHPDDGPGYVDAFALAVQRQTSFHGEVRVQDRQGRWRWIESWAQPRFSGSGEFLGHVGTSADVTDRKATEEALREGRDVIARQHAELELLYRTAPVGLCVLDRELRYVRVNDRLAAINGRPASEHLGRSVQEVLPQLSDQVGALIRQVLQTGQPVTDVELTTSATPGGLDTNTTAGQRSWRVSYVPVPASGDASPGIATVAGVAGVIHETTLERGLERALLEADRRKDAFLATLAHELRNPLAALTHAAHLLQSPVLGEARRAWAGEVVLRQAGQLGRLIDDLMDVSRVTMGRIELRREVLDLADLLGTAAQTAEAMFKARGQHFRVVLPGPGLLRVNGDAARLTQLFQNLLNNAAKYTGEGGHIVLEASLADAGQVRVSVRDDGVGLHGEDLGRIFEMFAQVTASRDRAEGGLGIGLFLVRRLAELHGGRVQASSAGPGCGSEFVVSLPACPSRATPAGADSRDSPDSADAAQASGASVLGLPPTHVEPRPRPREPRRVLVADDNPDMRESLCLLLRGAGCVVRGVADGRSAVQEALDWAPHLVLLDLGMPGLDGHAAAAALRADPRGRALKLVALTGWGQPEDIQRSRVAGFDQHLLKPAALDVLLALLS